MAIRSSAPALAAGVALLLAGGGRADEYRDAAHHFTLKLPPGWTQVPPNALAAANSFARVRGFGSVQYAAGFQRKNRPPMEYPYVLVQVQAGNTGGMTYDDLESSLARDGQAAMDKAVKQVQDKVTDIGKNLSIDKPGLDRAKNRFVAILSDLRLPSPKELTQ
jgi:hypothetical protein